MNHARFWEGVTVALLLICVGYVATGALTNDVTMLRAAAPVAGMSIATGTLALVRKP